MNHIFPTEPAELKIQVLLSEPGAKPHHPAEAIIDTGATLCFIASKLVKLLQLPTVDSADLKQPGYPETKGHPVVECHVLATDVGPIPVRAVEYEVDELILGMNWCNQVNGSYTRAASGWRLQIDNP